jgi:hypothetical protein
MRTNECISYYKIEILIIGKIIIEYALVLIGSATKQG